MRLRAHAAWPLVLLVAACSRKVSPDASPDPRGAPALAAGADGGAAHGTQGEAVRASIDAIAGFDDCALGHRGVLLDLGDPTARAAVEMRADRGRIESIERDGATWARVVARTVTLTFTASDAALAGDAEVPVVEARARGGSARSVTVYLNGKPAGVWPLTKGESSVVTAKLTQASTPNGAQLVAGTNELTLRFNGTRGAGPTDAQAEIDWIHVGAPDSEGAYGAPTRADALASVTIGGVPRRAVSLRAPGFARCSGWLPQGGKVTLSLALAGGTDADAEVRLLRDRAAPVVLGAYHLGAADAGAWKSVALPLGDLGSAARGSDGTLGAIELVATRASRGARVVFGEPKVVLAPLALAPAKMPAARGVVLVVMGELSPRAIEPYGGKLAMPELTALGKAGVVFDAHRATTTVPAGALASMITGIAPRAHGVADVDAALPPGVTTLADAVRQAGVVAAMFTANPTTGTAFGFPRGWDTFVEKTPLDEGLSTSIFDLAAGWIDAHKSERFLVVIHARGGHPPWDAAPDDLKSLPPTDYAGGIDPRHAAELLSKARKVPPQIRLNDDDRARAWALYGLAVRAHDAALGRLVAALRGAGREDDTLVIVTGDASVDEVAHVPFADGDALDEGTLAVPLVVRTPRAEPSGPDAPSMAGRHVGSPTSSVDIAPSILDALGLTPPTSFTGIDLWTIATGRGPTDGRPALAVLGRRSALRWGGFVLAGVRATSGDRDTKLCDLTLEPACVSDVRGAFPLALEALHRRTFDHLTAPDHARVAAVLDARSAAAVKAWGH